MADGNTTVKPRRARKSPAPTTTDPIEIAMGAEAGDAAPDSPARRVLLSQERLIGADLKLRGWEIADRRAVVALKLLLGIAALAVAAALGAMAWSARQAEGLVVEAFLVPPSLAAKGTSGQVVARSLLDRLAELDRATHALYETKVSDAWTESTKIEVPQTGVSLDEVQRLLRRWLGHETYLTGEVTETPAGLRLVARTGAGLTVAVEGPAETLPALTAQAAEQLYGIARPNAYAWFLINKGDLQGARKIEAGVLAGSDDPRQRAEAYHSLGRIAYREGRTAEAIAWFRRAMTSPDRLFAALAAGDAAEAEDSLGHAAAAGALQAEGARILGPGRTKLERQWARSLQGAVHVSRGDYLAAEPLIRPLVGLRVAGTQGVWRATYANVQASVHDLTAARAVFGSVSPRASLAAEDWDGLYRLVNSPGFDLSAPRSKALKVMTYVQLGRAAEVKALSDSTPLDCEYCLITRGLVADALGDVGSSDRWFAEAERRAPAAHFVLIYWGRSRLEQGRPDAAIEVFARLHKNAPRWADPLSWWGEALLAKGDAKGADAKFAQAAKLAPKWGRLHLKWGEALAKLGKADEAKAQWRLAGGLDLRAAERAELATVSRNRTP